ncbi:MAG TPA: HAMP domain-containing histidine kinase [Desulfobacterales bacterium]|nr:HAMP domain-containing histidine kinase [Desulfobacterales bacterium]HIP39171.1 HAMP domain-containing histidine kinase [Desulfocapsa sulfexigens]
MINKRFFWQLFPAALFVIVISIFAISWYGTQIIQKFYYQEMQEGIEDRAILLRPYVIQQLNSNPAQLQDFCRQIGRAAATRITVIAGDGKVLADSNENPAQMDRHNTRPEIMQAAMGKTGASLRFSKTLSQNMLYIAIPLDTQKPSNGVLRLSVSAAALDAVLSSARKKLLFGIVFIAFVAAGLSYVFARRISKPLEEMRTGAERLANGDIDHPIIISNNNVPREMTALSQSLNNMAEQLNGRIKQISQQRNELEAVFGSMTDGLLAISHNHTIISVNRAAAELFRIDSKTAQGVAFEGFIRSRVLQEFLTKAIDSDDSIRKNLTLMENGRQISLYCHAHPLFDGENRRIGSLVIVNDLTRINQLENIRQDFVANVSHELKTPITAIRGYVETLLDGAMDNREEAIKFLKIIHRQGARLDAIVDDLLTLAHIEDTAEKNSIELRREKICPILETAVQTCLVGAELKKIEIIVKCDPEMTAPANRPMLEQAIINLLTNAVSYSPERSTINVTAEQREDNTGRDIISISVQDQGPGISHEHQQRIFERFYRCDKARSRKHGGTGLGLSIVKHIADNHNGKVELVSRIGQGSTFIFSLPAGNVNNM